MKEKEKEKEKDLKAKMAKTDKTVSVLSMQMRAVQFSATLAICFRMFASSAVPSIPIRQNIFTTVIY